MRIRELRLLTRDIPNPTHDKRHRYGQKSIAVFKAGAVITYSPPTPYNVTVKGEPREVWHAAYLGYGNSNFTISDDLAQAIVSASAPHEADTWKDLARAFDTNPDGWLAAGILEDLLQNGVITKLQLQAAARNAYNSEA